MYHTGTVLVDGMQFTSVAQGGDTVVKRDSLGSVSLAPNAGAAPAVTNSEVQNTPECRRTNASWPALETPTKRAGRRQRAVSTGDGTSTYI